MNDLRKKILALIITLAMSMTLTPSLGFVYAEDLDSEVQEVSAETGSAEDTQLPDQAEEVTVEAEPSEEDAAEETAPDETAEGEITVSIEAKQEKIVPDDDTEGAELFDGYLKMKASGTRVKRTAGNRLKGANKVIYDYLKAESTKVAAGRREYTVFTLSAEELLGEKNYWTAADLGLKSLTDADGKVTDAALRKVQNPSSIINALLADNPYGLYWYDKTSSTRVKGFNLYLAVVDGEERIIADGTGYYSMPVAKEYSKSKTAGTYYFDTGVGQSASGVVSKAQAIVDKYDGLDDKARITGYGKEICRLVSYNNGAVFSDEDYGDPWQLIWVFDGDPSTNVVCEGYAKAFKFLCDISGFSGSVDCIVVTGMLGSEGHMWNVVTLDDGFNYMVDVTNSDGGSIMASNGLFMCRTPASSSYPSYVFSSLGRSLKYTYDGDCMSIFSKEELMIPGEAGHHKLSKIGAVAATCTKPGSREYYVCDDCGQLFADAEGKEEISEYQTVVRATGHKIQKVSTAATCEHAGMKSHYECLNCHKMYTSAAGTKELTAKQIKKLTIKQKSHSYKKKVISDEYLKSKATCTKKATYYYSCKCGKRGKKTFTYGKALGHSYSELVKMKPATVKSNGSIVKKCSRCSKKHTTTIYKASKVSIAKKYGTVAYKGNNAETTTVTVKNSKGKTISKEYYDLSFDNNYVTGKGKATVTFKGDYSGTKVIEYKIKGIPKQ